MRLKQKSRNEHSPISRQGKLALGGIALALSFALVGDSRVKVAAASTWCWDAVTLSCAGNPTDVAFYVLLVAYLVPTPYACLVSQCGPSCDPVEPSCCVDVPGTCIGYTLTSWTEGARVPGSETCTSWDVADPPLNAVTLVNVVAENSNGQGPMTACP